MSTTNDEIEVVAQALDSIPDQHARMTATATFRRLVLAQEAEARQRMFDRVFEAIRNEMRAAQTRSDTSQNKIEQALGDVNRRVAQALDDIHRLSMIGPTPADPTPSKPRREKKT